MDAQRRDACLAQAGLRLPEAARLEIEGHDPILASRFAVGEAAAVAHGLAACTAVALHALRGGEPQSVRVEVRAAAASLLGFLLQSVPGLDLTRFRNPATDYTTGALAAYGVMEALRRRATEGGSWWVRASLCQTGMWLTRLGASQDPAAAQGLGDVSSLQQACDTAWGRLAHLAPVPRLPKTPARCDRPPAPLGAHAAEWLPR